ncbi:uncharacterized protein [Argopecten irradians]|uniref:uncharacterized protein n=1 Tax=Argopecten irradians TaxID=31199 RepID=UPI00371D7B83
MSNNLNLRCLYINILCLFLVNRHLLEYAKRNLSYWEIALLLQKQCGVKLSANAIGKRLKKLGSPSKRGPLRHTDNEIRQAVQNALAECPITVGYRHMTDILRSKGYHVRRDTVMQVLRELDPIGVHFRHRRRIRRKVYCSAGPNNVWHVDGYDKLKPYGFAIHGCIDGFSRRLMWLNVASTNNNPKVMAANYVECVKSVKGCPLILQADPGTENFDMGALQCFFRRNHSDMFSKDRSFRVVRSVFNQRIEAWWSMFRRQKSQWFMDLFKDLEVFGAFRKDHAMDIYCLRYCFMPLIQRELDAIKDQWNSHRISQSRQAICPGGRPDVLYLSPESVGGKECLQKANDVDIDWAFTQCQEVCRSGCQEFDAFAGLEFLSLNWEDASTVDESLRQYFHLITLLGLV